MFQIKSVRKCRRKNIQNDYIPNKKKVKLVVPKKDKIIDLTIGEEGDIDDESKCEISLIVRIILISERNGKVLGVLYFLTKTVLTAKEKRLMLMKKVIVKSSLMKIVMTKKEKKAILLIKMVMIISLLVLLKFSLLMKVVMSAREK